MAVCVNNHNRPRQYNPSRRLPPSYRPLITVIPAPYNRHSGASRNLSFGERRPTGQTTYYAVIPTPSPVIPTPYNRHPDAFTRHPDPL